MAHVRFRGDAPAVAQVVTATPANVETGDVFTLTINGKSVSYTAAAPQVADVTAGLTAAVAASAIPEFQELAAADAETHMTLTARTAGVPFVVAASATNGGAADTQTLTLATVTASAGPAHWDCPANWSSGAVPASGDHVFLEETTRSLLYGLDQTGITLGSLNIAASFTGELGLPPVNREGATDYAEYRPRSLLIGADAVQIGHGQGPGSGRLQLDTLAAATAVTVHFTGLATDDEPAFHWRGENAANSLNVLGGSVGVALSGEETAELATLRQSAGDVRCGAGVTVVTIERSGAGTLTLAAAAGTLRQSGGETLVLGSGGVDTLSLTGGRVDYRSSGALATVTLAGLGATLDFSADLRARTVASCTLAQGTIIDPHRTVTWTTGIQPAAHVQAM